MATGAFRDACRWEVDGLGAIVFLPVISEGFEEPLRTRPIFRDQCR